jgi:hypothetical protein
MCCGDSRRFRCGVQRHERRALRGPCGGSGSTPTTGHCRGIGGGVPLHAGPRRPLPRWPRLGGGPFGTAGVLACALAVSFLLVSVQNDIAGSDHPPSGFGATERATPRSVPPPSHAAEAPGDAVSVPAAGPTGEGSVPASAATTGRPATRARVAKAPRFDRAHSGRKCGHARRSGQAKPGCPQVRTR